MMRLRQATNNKLSAFSFLFSFLFLFLFTLSTQTWAYQHHCPSGNWQSQLLIHLINVGQGDSTFIRTPSGTTILIDAGDLGKGVADVLPTISKCYKLTSIDYLILTHPHVDHYGGLIDVLKKIKINRAIYDGGDSVLPLTGTTFNKYYQLAMKPSNAKRRVANLGNTLVHNDGSNVLFNVVSINAHTTGNNITRSDNYDYDSDNDNDNDNDNSNNTNEDEDIIDDITLNKKNKSASSTTSINPNSLSLAMVISYGKFKYYTGGDLTGAIKAKTPDLESLVANTIGSVDVMKSNHHGSAGSNNLYFLSTLKPKHVLVTVGEGGKNLTYHLPNYNIIERMLLLSPIKTIYQTTVGEMCTSSTDSSDNGTICNDSEESLHSNNKIKIENDDIIVVANKNSYSINNVNFTTTSR
ncbi:MAG: MBL fold metallo-hydrolase [Oligoflexia bacterium]|nr:MBL fold metallo-hydrolase [Oligoflexia bacterium]